MWVRVWVCMRASVHRHPGHAHGRVCDGDVVHIVHGVHIIHVHGVDVVHGIAQSADIARGKGGGRERSGQDRRRGRNPLFTVPSHHGTHAIHIHVHHGHAACAPVDGHGTSREEVSLHLLLGFRGEGRPAPLCLGPSLGFVVCVIFSIDFTGFRRVAEGRKAHVAAFGISMYLCW